MVSHRQVKKQLKKWRFALGTTSRVPSSPGWHYLILDLDTRKISLILSVTLAHTNYFMQKTRSGWHIYTPLIFRFNDMLDLSLLLGSDPAWIEIARKRGYAFLADKKPANIFWPVERMAIGAAKK
jgi:hypothetical protein